MSTINSTPDSAAAVKISPYHAAYFAPDPQQYSHLTELGYNPEVAVLPDYCRVVFDCACLYGNTSLACMYGWDFSKATEFWNTGFSLTEEQREATLLGRRLYMIGLDGSKNAVDYSMRMNIIDQGIVQNFEHEPSFETLEALSKADVWVMQQCLSYMPFENLKTWMQAFLRDRTRPKRFIYDFNPYFDGRNMAPGVILDGVNGWKVTYEKYYAYRQKTEEEFASSQENGRDMCVHHYVVDFSPL
jgi:SAM-dependent methyltransferase